LNLEPKAEAATINTSDPAPYISNTEGGYSDEMFPHGDARAEDWAQRQARGRGTWGHGWGSRSTHGSIDLKKEILLFCLLDCFAP